jgi:hypothetical protein
MKVFSYTIIGLIFGFLLGNLLAVWLDLRTGFLEGYSQSHLFYYVFVTLITLVGGILGYRFSTNQSRI